MQLAVERHGQLLCAGAYDRTMSHSLAWKQTQKPQIGFKTLLHGRNSPFSLPYEAGTMQIKPAAKDHPQDPRRSPVALIKALMVTMSWMAENLHKHMPV